MNKPREFWINTITLEVHYGELKGADGNVHVIEYSAVASLQKEIEEFKTGVQNFKCPNCNKLAGPFYPVNLINELENLNTDFLALRAELKECEDLATGASNLVGKFMAEGDALRADLKLAVEALDNCVGEMEDLTQERNEHEYYYKEAQSINSDLNTKLKIAISALEYINKEPRLMPGIIQQTLAKLKGIK